LWIPSTGFVVTADIERVGIDLTRVPLDEVLDFRAEHGAEYRSYARELRRFVNDLAIGSPEEQARMMHDRAEALADRAAELRNVSLVAFGRPALALLMSMAGAGWTITQGDPVGALLAAAAAATAFKSPQSTVSAFTYLFRAQDLGR
jgi:hypothetical protein